ncbi:BrnA antitoxin family protein [Ralstonia pseudosolanacearum]|uniref:BrnA antitoxin family protein n=1 Tax=Ralstonia pseudosolanacearum TaxID=1310165 RepID=UPI001C8BE28F|nr:BrnA antitoxin family protein [Ralstonia pseudosolanacearum]MBX9427906.1 BrnA antitoxin family protein [Ralstonia pseudosolanacearum]
MTKAHKIAGSEEAWDTGMLGADEQHAHAVRQETKDAVDKTLGLQAVSIRLPKTLIENFKLIAKIHGMGYQPLMREALLRFAEGETKVLLNQYAERLEQELAKAKESPHHEHREAA